MVKVQKINSIALTVADIQRSQDFYTQALGFKTVDDLTLEESSLSQLASIPPTRTTLTIIANAIRVAEHLKQLMMVKGF